ncbi:NADH:flavin oxidoreductase [Aeromicrobium wangtongii]|uniref:NADH:flavin oxidoreductase n=1 Tax=Aeromicrobium wangtongii TaxID=2969247 RepID=UPI00201767BF|nr:NADH:flavin oxidoreductase [Aeromicrobium wangtongii]MCL3820041.1 NADH:flavin oxidoreductase [Aeromicrobium wangtongii]
MPISLSDPLILGHGPTWPNRVALAPLTNTQSHADGTLSDEELAWLTARGRGGFGLTMTCAAYVSPAGQAWGGQLGIAGDEHLPGLARLAQALRQTGTRSSVQLHHAGRRADPAVTGRPLQCPWAPDATTPAMTTAEIGAVISDFAGAAVRAEQAGFDGVELHGAHGYLIGQFLDGRHDDRTDGYGGTPQNRARMLFEVLAEVRRATGPGFQVGLRLTPEGNGITVDEGRETARRVLASGLVDYLDMSLWDVFMYPRAGGDRLLIDHFVDLPRHGTRLGVAGRVLSSKDAAWCLDRGADFVSVGIGGILHHDWAARAIADPRFAARERPVSADVLRREHVGPAFIDYLDRGWENFVAAGR